MNIVLYSDGVDNLDIEDIIRYIKQKSGKITVEDRGNPFINLPEDSVADYAAKLAKAKVQQLDRPADAEQEPLYGEIAYETRRIQGKTSSFGVIYDGVYLRRLLLEIIPSNERRLEAISIIFTNRLLATWDEGNRRYHLRASLYSLPSVISTTGIVEAPAKPREYYILKQQYLAMGKDLTELNEKFKGRFIDYDDERLTEVTKGYIMQAVFYALTGDPFCEDKGCRLYNSHWQEDLIFAQIESEYEFCPRHTAFLNKLCQI